MRQVFKALGLAGALVIGLAGAASAETAPATPTAGVQLTDNVPVAWSQYHGRRHGWRHHRGWRHGWHHRHRGWHHRHGWRRHHRW